MSPELDRPRIQIQRIVASKAFKTSEVHRNLLNYLAEKSLGGEAQNLKEYTVGLDVFGKPASYDPRQESVVRMHVGRLRQKLAEYYRTEGLEDSIIVDLPKGGFALTFDPRPAPAPVDVLLRVNGGEHRLTLDARTTLLDALRENLHLNGTKKGCGLGQCGACTVLMEGKRVKSCLSLAALVDGREITTIEGVATGDQLHPLQVAFIERDAFQCGYCTSGQIMSGIACIAEGHAQSAVEIREWMSGNLCRCGAYDHIVTAIRDVAAAQRGA